MPTVSEIREAVKEGRLSGSSGLNHPSTIGKTEKDVNDILCDHDLDKFEGAGGATKGPDRIYYHKCQECGFVFSTWFEGR